MRKMKLTVLFSAFMVLLPMTFASANELTVVEAPATGMSSMSGVVGGQEIYYTASFTKSTTVVKYGKYTVAQEKKLNYKKMAKQSRFAHRSK